MKNDIQATYDYIKSFTGTVYADVPAMGATVTLFLSNVQFYKKNIGAPVVRVTLIATVANGSDNQSFIKNVSLNFSTIEDFNRLFDSKTIIMS
jgi:hypothetical protein